MFIDKVKIYIKAGNGGNGSASLHTEKYVPNGGPDGGDGGKGGDIVFVATTGENTLNAFHFQKHFRAENGENGGGNNHKSFAVLYKRKFHHRHLISL